MRASASSEEAAAALPDVFSEDTPDTRPQGDESWPATPYALPRKKSFGVGRESRADSFPTQPQLVLRPSLPPRSQRPARYCGRTRWPTARPGERCSCRTLQRARAQGCFVPAPSLWSMARLCGCVAGTPFRTDWKAKQELLGSPR